jgi:hypothetical protein
MPRPHTAYMTWLLIFFIAPTLIMWIFAYDTLWKYRATFKHCIILGLVFGVTWDYFAIVTKMWYWPELCCFLPRVAGLPLEEVVFIVSVVIAICTTTLIARDIYDTHRKHLARRK